MAARPQPSDNHKPHPGGVDPGLLLILVLALIAASPFLTRPGLPRGTDAELHVFRAAELGHSLAAGDLYPRWAPDFYYGYGYPIFNYYAPLTYYLANLFHLLPGISIVAGVKLVFILGLIGAAVGIYLFVRDWAGTRAALLAAALYVLAPYVFFVDPHIRGVLAESFSLGLFPVALWAYQRVMVDKRHRWSVIAAISQAALIMSHNLLGVVLSGILLAFIAWELAGRGLSLRRQNRTPTALQEWWPLTGRVLLTTALGFGLSSIFWLPLLLERSYVQLQVTGPGHFDFHRHFLNLTALLRPSPILDLGALAPDIAFNLGLPHWPLALLALPAWVFASPRLRRPLGFFILCTLGLVALMLPVSTPIWENIPGLELLQFPWRLLGPASATLSITAGVGFSLTVSRLTQKLGRARARHWNTGALAAAIGATLYLALPAMFPPLWEEDFGPTDAAAIIQFELSGVAVGTTSTGDYLPNTVEILPHPEPAYLATYSAPGGVDKVNRATLRGDTKVETLSHGPTHDRFRVESSKPFTLRLFTHYFPGWRAAIDGQEAPIELGRPEGFITIGVPAGTHIVEVRFHELGTRPRTAGTLLSLLSVIALLLIPMRSWVERQGRTNRMTPVQAPLGATASDRPLDWMDWVFAGAVILTFLLFKVGLVDRQHDWFRYTSPPGRVLAAQYALSDDPVRFGHSIQLLGFDLPKTEVPSGGNFPLTLYWRATEPVETNYQAFAHLTRPITHLWGQSDNLNPGEIPTQRWPLDKYVQDEHRLEILPGTPPGVYQLTVGLYTLSDGRRVPVSRSDGESLGDTFSLPIRVHVTRPRRPPERAELALTDVIDKEYAEQVRLLGVVLTDRTIELPGFLHMALLWQAVQDQPDDITVYVRLVDSEGQTVDQVITRPVNGRYGSPAWSAGEIVRDPYSFWLEENFEPGSYDLLVGLQDHADGVSLGQVEMVKR